MQRSANSISCGSATKAAGQPAIFTGKVSRTFSFCILLI